MGNLLVVFLFLAGCVSAHKANFSKQSGPTVDSNVRVSVEKNTTMSTDNFMVLEYTLENTGSKFKRFKNVELTIPKNLKEQVKLVVGQDLKNWAEGIKNKVELDEYNRALILSSIAAIGVAGASFSNDPNFQKISAGAALAGAGTIAVDDFMTIRNRVQDSSKYDTRGLIPDNHILSSPVNIPPNLFLKRFAVFYIPPETKNLFYTKELRLTGAADTLNLSFKTNFAPVPIPRKARCEPGDLPILFRRMTIGCLADCERMHPFNRKSCVEAYKRQHPED